MALAAAGFHPVKAQHTIFSFTSDLRFVLRKLSSSWGQTHLNQTRHGLQEWSHDQIQALCQQGQLQRALHLLFVSAIHPPDHVYLSLLKACKKEKTLGHVQQVYYHLINHPVKKLSSTLGNYLLLTLVACGGLDVAYQVFKQLPVVAPSSWMSIISCYAESGQYIKALELYTYMLQARVEPNSCTLVNVLKCCGGTHDLDAGKKLHSDAVERGYHVDVFVGSTLVSMYAKCGSLLEAENVFGSLEQRNVVSWNVMLASYVDHHREDKALRLYRQMQEEGVNSNSLTLVPALQACGSLGNKEYSDSVDWCADEQKSVALNIGQALHAVARKAGLATDPFVQSALLTMYRKCDSIAAVEAVFVSLSEPNAVSWNVILIAYAEQGQEKKALQLYRKLYEEGVIPGHQTFITALTACCSFAGKGKAVYLDGPSDKVSTYELGRALHFDAWKNRLVCDVIIGSQLINLYAKCGTVAEAEYVFRHLSRVDLVAWNTMLSSYVEQAEEEKAFMLYRQMQEEGVCQNERTFVIAFQICGNFAGKEKAGLDGQYTKMIAHEIGKALHSAVRKEGFESTVFVANTLLSMYGKCGCITHAENVFDSLSVRDIVSWNAMLSVYIDEGQYGFALQMYRQLKCEGYAPDQLTFTIILQACGIAAAEEATTVGKQPKKRMPVELVRGLHSEAVIMGFDTDTCTKTGLISVYGKCGTVMETEKLFVETFQLDTVCWNAMLFVYVENNHGERALQLYKQMQERSFVDERTVVIALKACVCILKKEEPLLNEVMISEVCLEIGLRLHAYARKNRLESNVFVGSALINMYGKCGCIARAEDVFDRIPKQSKVLWSTMMSAYIEYGEGERALQLFRVMQSEYADLDRQTLTIALQACCYLAEKQAAVVLEGQPIKALSLRIGQALHAEMAQNVEFSHDVYVGNALVSMYGKCGAIREAERTFHCLSEGSALPWNGILSAFVDYEHWEKIVELYSHIEKARMSLDDITLLYILQALSQIGSVEVCRRVQFIAAASEHCISSILSTNFIRAYGYCGCLPDAEAVFYNLIQPDVVAWSACLSGFAEQGDSRSSFHFLNGMQIEGIVADEVTCSSFLSACTHAGLVNEGLCYFGSMNKLFGLTPHVKHYANVIDLLARTGNLADVEHMLRKMPIKADLAIWVSVLSACSLHGNVELAKLVLNSAIQLQPAEYTLLSNMYWKIDPCN